MPKEVQRPETRTQVPTCSDPTRREARPRAAGTAHRPETVVVPRNEVLLVGRVSAAPQERTLPSGDVLVSWRVVVARPTTGRSAPASAMPGSGRASTVDAVDCIAWGAGVRRTVGSWVVGDVVKVEGALRRRFWRSPAGSASRCEVEVLSARRMKRAG